MAKWKPVGCKRVIEINTDEVIFLGVSCKVYGGRFDESEVAVKRIDRMRTNFKCEVEALRKLQHPNIVLYRYKDQDEDDEYVYIALEKCICSLQDCLDALPKAHNIQLSELDLLRQITTGLNYLHENNVLHRDLHPSNILFSVTNGKVTAKISDFGVMKKLRNDSSSVSVSGTRGTECYMSPEAIKKEKINEKSDVFSLGLVCFNVLVGKQSPYGGNELDITRNIRDGAAPNLQAISDKHNGYAFQLIASMLRHVKEERPNTHDILAHYLFWYPEKAILFLQHVSDDLNDNKEDSLCGEMMQVEDEVLRGQNFTSAFQHLTQDQQQVINQDLQRFRPPDHGVCGLLRQIRNWAHHYDQKPSALKDVIGNNKLEMLNFFTSRFPLLLPRTYEIFRHRKQHANFMQFY